MFLFEKSFVAEMLKKRFSSLLLRYIEINHTQHHQHQFQTNPQQQYQRRKVSTELATALRPFYFAVHPDRFGKHPEQRRVNENSMKQLSSHIELLYDRRYHIISETKIIKFYIRDGEGEKRDTFKLIKIKLDQRIRDPKIIINKLLQLCGITNNLIIDNTTSTTDSTTAKSSTLDNFSGPHGRHYDFDYTSDFMNFGHEINQTKAKKKNLSSWIDSNASLAQERAEELRELKDEVERLRLRLIGRLKLLDIRYDCGWNFEHFRGCLKSLERLANMHEIYMAILTGRIVVFAPFTGVSLEGHIMLFTGDVLNSWIDFIKRIRVQDEFLKKIPIYENTLSQVFLNIQIGRRKFMPKQQAVEYAGHLIKVTTTLGDYLSFHKYPKTWPSTLCEYEIVIESEAGPLMVNPTGQLIAPATCPGFMLIDFINNNMAVAKELRHKYNAEKHIERELCQHCIQFLNLTSLTKGDNVTPNKMIETMRKLLKCNATPFKNLSLHITNYYSVLSDGVVCIPWDFATNKN